MSAQVLSVILIRLLDEKFIGMKKDNNKLSNAGADPGFSEGGFGQTSAYII